MTSRKTHITAAERVAREDAITFINACLSSTGQNEFYESGITQGMTLDFLHAYMLANYRSLYAKSITAGITHFNQGLVITNLLLTGKDLTGKAGKKEREAESRLIHAALVQMPPQRALKILVKLVEMRVNNRRTRAIIRDFLAARPDPVFDAVKYRKHIKKLARHAHLGFDDERNEFLFHPAGQKSFRTPLFESYRAAHYAENALYELPFIIAEGLAARLGIDRGIFLQKAQKTMTELEKLRLQRASERDTSKGKTLEVDLNRLPLTRLAIFLLSMPFSERKNRRPELKAAFRQAAEQIVRRHPFQLPRTAAIFDCSFSMSGSQEKKNRPLALAVGLNELLKICTREYRAFWTPSLEDTFLAEARGQSDLTSPLLDALAWHPEQLIILSDGYENAPPEAFDFIYQLYRKYLDKKHNRLPIIHLNPVYESGLFGVRSLSPDIVTAGIRDVEDFFALISFARFSAGKAPLSALQQYLSSREKEFLAKAAHKQRADRKRVENMTASQTASPEGTGS